MCGLVWVDVVKISSNNGKNSQMRVNPGFPICTPFCSNTTNDNATYHLPELDATPVVEKQIKAFKMRHEVQPG